MDSKKYIGMDVHQATISVAVRDAVGKLVMESIVETKAATILQFIQGIHGSLWVTFKEGTSAAWLYDLLQPHVAQVVVCDPRRNALLKAGNKNDRVDARKLSDLLRVGLLTPVYHGQSGVRTLRELARSYLTITKDLTRVMNRLKGLYRSWAISTATTSQVWVVSKTALKFGQNSIRTDSLHGQEWPKTTIQPFLHPSTPASMIYDHSSAVFRVTRLLQPVQRKKPIVRVF